MFVWIIGSTSMMEMQKLNVLISLARLGANVNDETFNSNALSYAIVSGNNYAIISFLIDCGAIVRPHHIEKSIRFRYDRLIETLGDHTIMDQDQASVALECTNGFAMRSLSLCLARIDSRFEILARNKEDHLFGRPNCALLVEYSSMSDASRRIGLLACMID